MAVGKLVSSSFAHNSHVQRSLDFQRNRFFVSFHLGNSCVTLSCTSNWTPLHSLSSSQSSFLSPFGEDDWRHLREWQSIVQLWVPGYGSKTLMTWPHFIHSLQPTGWDLWSEGMSGILSELMSQSRGNTLVKRQEVCSTAYHLRERSLLAMHLDSCRIAWQDLSRWYTWRPSLLACRRHVLGFPFVETE
jgi:hypothetical protein